MGTALAQEATKRHKVMQKRLKLKRKGGQAERRRVKGLPKGSLRPLVKAKSVSKSVFPMAVLYCLQASSQSAIHYNTFLHPASQSVVLCTSFPRKVHTLQCFVRPGQLKCCKVCNFLTKVADTSTLATLDAKSPIRYSNFRGKLHTV
jgi:hypothetical protein